MLFNQGIDLPDALRRDALTVDIMPERRRYSLRIKPADLVSFKKTTGLTLPRKINSSKLNQTETCLCLGPDEWMVIADTNAAEKLDKAFVIAGQSFTCSVTDISHRNVAFKISGDEAENLINVGCPLDLSLEAFPVGKVTRTIFENAPIMLLRSGQNDFHLECWRSFAPYLRDYFTRVVTT